MKARPFIGDYKLGKTLGEGSFSKVKLAVHNGTGEKFAVKIVDKIRMRELAVKSKKIQEERERQRIISEKKRARSESIKKQNMVIQASPNEPNHDTGPPDLQKLIKDLANINAELENVQVPEEALRPEAEYMPNMQKEVKLLMRLDHPNVIKTYKIFDSEDECYIIMELAKGGELMEYITSHGKLSEKESRKFFRQIVSAIDHIHNANIVHRDLKLENILLSKDVDCLIADFGLGRTYQSENVDDMKTFCGTPNYASIELVAGLPYNGIKSDIWALGVILYIMCSGVRPFRGSTIAVLYQKILRLDYDIPTHFSNELVDLLKRIFVKDAKKRISIAEIRDHPWMNLDYSEKIPQIPAKPLLDDVEDIGRAIGSIYNDHEFTVFTLKSHSTSKKSSPNVSDSNVKLSRQIINTSSLRIEINKSSNVLDYQPPQQSEMLGRGRRASLQESRSFTRTKAEHEPDLMSRQGSIGGKAKLAKQDTSQKLPSSFSNELVRKPSSGSSSQFSYEPYRRRGSVISDTSSSVIFDTKQKGSLSLCRPAIKSIDDDDIDVSDAADLAVQAIVRSRRMSIGPDKRATIKEEEPISHVTSNSSLDEIRSNATQTHEEFPLREYSYARRPSYRRLSIVEVKVLGVGEPSAPATAKENPIVSRRPSFSAARRDSHSFIKESEISTPLPFNNSPKLQPITRRGSINESHDREFNRKRAATIAGTRSNQSSSKFVAEENRFEIWDDDGMRNHASTTSKNSQETSLSSAQAITLEMINDWHQIHRPAKTIRTMRYSFNKSTTSSILEPPRIFQDVHKVLLDIADAGEKLFTLSFQRTSDLYLFECNVEYLDKEDILKFEIEVCKVWLLKMHGIRMKRLQGDAFDYKQLYNDIIERLAYNG